MDSPDEDNLPEELRALEDRLARRAGPQGDEGFRRRVLDAVARELKPRPRRRWWAAAAAAACLAVAAALLLRPTDSPPADRQSTGTQPVCPTDAVDGPAPTFTAYREALRQSPEKLDEMLTYHGYVLLRRSADEQDIRPRW